MLHTPDSHEQRSCGVHHIIKIDDIEGIVSPVTIGCPIQSVSHC